MLDESVVAESDGGHAPLRMQLRPTPSVETHQLYALGCAQPDAFETPLAWSKHSS